MNKSMSRNNQANESKGPGTRAGIERMFKIASYLQNGKIDGKKVNCKTLGEALEVDRTTVMRDLAFLRDRMGMEFEWDGEGQEYVLTGDYHHLPCMQLNEVDKLLLSYIEQMISGFENSELGYALQESFSKISGIFTGKNPQKGWGIQAKFLREEGKSVSDLKVFHLAQRAIASSSFLKIVCKKTDQNQFQMILLKPTQVVYQTGKWILQGVVAGTPEAVLFREITEIELVKNQPSDVGPAATAAPRDDSNLQCAVSQADEVPRRAA